jgi:hypothetical protein
MDINRACSGCVLESHTAQSVGAKCRSSMAGVIPPSTITRWLLLSGALPAQRTSMWVCNTGGLGDILVAVLAFAVVGAMRAEFAKTLLVIWNTIGLIDIIFVVSSALRFGLRDWQSMHALRELPLSLLPTFLVPLIIASHILIFVRLTREGDGQV